MRTLLLVALCLAYYGLGWASHATLRSLVLCREAERRRREVERWREVFERAHDWGSGERVEVYFGEDQGSTHSCSGDRDP